MATGRNTSQNEDHPMPDKAPDIFSRLTDSEAEQLAAQVAHLSAAQLPLASGLRAAADECDSGRLAAAAYWLAEQIDLGRRLEDVLTSVPQLFPRHVCGLLAAAVRTGRLGSALSELVEHQRAAGSLRRSVMTGLAYPLVVASLGLLILLFITVHVGGACERMLIEFRLKLPLTTELFFWWRGVGLWVLAGFAVLVLLVTGVLRACLGSARWQHLLTTLPVIGPLWHWSGVVEWSSLLRVLTEHQVPLLESLRLAAEGISNSHVGAMSLELADGIARGRSLSQLMASGHEWPACLVPLVRWGEETGTLAEALGAGREMLEERVRMRSLLLQMALPPVLFIAIGCLVLFAVGAMFMPMINLVQGLS
ncbi:MAG: type II secretion system F family protein [Planctomycetota bacterium]|nr:type II secretion system F family protein [Planctomycetota bacterium]